MPVHPVQPSGGAVNAATEYLANYLANYLEGQP
jgi:hypothetical protein